MSARVNIARHARIRTRAYRNVSSELYLHIHAAVYLDDLTGNVA